MKLDTLFSLFQIVFLSPLVWFRLHFSFFTRMRLLTTFCFEFRKIVRVFARSSQWQWNSAVLRPFS
jgi:hypothetical protein